MKKQFLLSGLCALALTTLTQAQPVTGQSIYQNGNLSLNLSSGTYVNTNPGFIMAGYLPSFNNSANFVIDKVNQGGLFTSSTDFSRQYKAISCSGTQANICNGVSVTEVPAGSTAVYAIAGAFDAGCLFATLNGGGGPLVQRMYQYPTGAANYHQPSVIAASSSIFYVCGSYDLTSGGVTTGYMYLMRIDLSGSSGWSQTYNVGTGNRIVAYSSVLDVSGQLAVVGSAFMGSTPEEGFFITLNSSNGSVIKCERVGTNGMTACGFRSIGLTPNGQNYIVGGYSAQFSFQSWMALITSAGAVSWSSVLKPSTAQSPGAVIGVCGRHSQTYGADEFYGAALSSSGMLVLKLDANGNPFSQSPNVNNEFIYDDNAGVKSKTGAISFFNTAGAINTGIHVFGTTSSAAPENLYLTQAFFNGVSGTCPSTSRQNLTTQSQPSTGPNVIDATVSNLTTGLSLCSTSGVLTTSSITCTPSQTGMFSGIPTSPYTGTNNRTMQPTSIREFNAEEDALMIYPNPVNSATEISYNLANGGTMKVELFDAVGKLIAVIDSGSKPSGTQTLKLDLGSMNLQSGIYFVKLTTNTTVSQQKILYNRN